MNQSDIQTVIVVILTSSLRLAASPGNVLLSAKETGLPKASVVNVSQIVTVDKGFLSEYVGELEPDVLLRVADGLRLVMVL